MHFQARTRVLQAYVNDLSEQNEVLVQTVEELEREANERVEMLESKLQKTSGTHKVLHGCISKLKFLLLRLIVLVESIIGITKVVYSITLIILNFLKSVYL